MKILRTCRASTSFITVVPRCWRICFFVRLIIPCRLLAWGAITLPVAESLNRFFAPDLVFSLGIWLVSVGKCCGKPQHLDPFLVRLSFMSRHGSPLAGQLEGRFDTRRGHHWQPERESLSAAPESSRFAGLPTSARPRPWPSSRCAHAR